MYRTNYEDAIKKFKQWQDSKTPLAARLFIEQQIVGDVLAIKRSGKRLYTKKTDGLVLYIHFTDYEIK